MAIQSPVTPVAAGYQAVGANASATALGANSGAKGDFLASVIVTVATAATGTVSITDGSGSAIPLTAANTPIGGYTIYLNIFSTSGAWKITTGAGATVLATGSFT